MPYLNDIHPTYATKFTISEWKEAIENSQVGGESISLEAGQATISVKVPWARLLPFLRFTLGWSYVNGTGSSQQLRRENPVRHPRMPWLTAANVSLQGIGPVGVEGVGTKVIGLYSNGLYVAKYDTVVATVTFADRPWIFAADSDTYAPSQESNRNIFLTPTPSVEIISAEGLNNIKFAHGPQSGNAIPAPFGTLMSKVTYTVNWMWVPHEYISVFAYPTLYPTNILNCIGRVNSQPFLGFAAGTMLLQAPVFEPLRFPMATNQALQQLGFYGWNVRFPVQFFDPSRGAGFSDTYRGHQCVPLRTDLLWYGCLREDNSSKLFPEADLNDIFANPN